jgi:uncharacterized protein YoxC
MENITGALIAIAFLVIVFLVARELVLWYWKINTIVRNQEKTNFLLKKYMESKGVEFSKDDIDRLNS